MKIKLINYGYIEKPFRAHYNDAGADVYSNIDLKLKPHQTVKIALGFGLDLPDGLMCCVYPRSSMSAKGIISQIPPVDSGYKGEMHCILTNTTDNDYEIKTGDRIGQLVITPIILAEFVEELGNERGDKAFGSSGR